MPATNMGCASARRRPESAIAASGADARVCLGVAHVGQHVPGQGQARAQHEVGHDKRIVARHDALVEELPQARQGEYLLDDDRAADEAGDGQAQQRDDRQQGVSQCVAVDDHVLGEALGARGEDVVLAQHLQHGGAHVAAHARKPAEYVDEHGQGQMRAEVQGLSPPGHQGMVRRGQAGDGENGPDDAEKQHQQQRQPESGHGKAHEHEHGGCPVKEAVLFGGCRDAYGDGQREREDKGSQVHAEGQGQAFLDLVPDGTAVAGEGVAEVQLGEAFQPQPVLNVDGLIQAVELLQAGHGLGSDEGVQVGLEVGGFAGGQMHDPEAHQGDPQEHHDEPDGFDEKSMQQG